MKLYFRDRRLIALQKRLSPTLLMMKLTVFFIVLASLATSARGLGQQLELREKNASLEKIFADIKKQSGYYFFVDKGLLTGAKPVTVTLKGTIQQILDAVLKDQPLSYRIDNKTIFIVRKETPTKITENLMDAPADAPSLRVVVKANSLPLSGATVHVIEPNLSAMTDDKGVALFETLQPGRYTVEVSFVGYEKYDQKVVVRQNAVTIGVALSPTNSTLDESVVIAYGTTTKRLNTGSVGKVTSKEIEQQPVANPIAALEGRVAGLFITQATGLPGASFTVQLRGQNSMNSGTSPLYIIDGVPFNSTSLDRTFLGPISTQSPFASINPSDIESIEVLKDADATAIYGSRGANGVIMITTKKGKAGPTRVNANIYGGVGKVTRMLPLMNTKQYLEMRREAFKNDGLTPSADPSDPAYAPDLMVWDTTRNTDWQKLMMGGTAHITDAQVTVDGGNQQTQFLVGANYHYESTVAPGPLSDKRANVHFSLTHRSNDGRFGLSLSASYNNDRNRLVFSDPQSVLNVPPNAPGPYDKDGRLVWYEKGANFFNPFGYLNQPYQAVTDNLISNMVLSYKIIPQLTARVNGGFNYTQLEQSTLYPASSQNPAWFPASYAQFGSNNLKSYLLEPQLELQKNIGKGNLSVLAGLTFQQQLNKGNSVSAYNYSNDALLSTVSGAGTLIGFSAYSLYRYNAGFARINYNYDGKYLLNLTGRRDGSTRFGPGKQFANFGAVGAAWIFSKEDFFSSALPFVSFGKLRGSYGTSGNDQIGDYQYLDSWRSVYLPYRGASGIMPASLYNPNFAWETNKKMELALELGLMQERILLNVNYFRNISGNQLVNYTVPAQSGFGSLNQNLAAKIENKGWELQLNIQNIRSRSFSWRSSLNLTIARNRLLEFPGLAESSYATTYVIGQPVSIKRGFHAQGVDPKTGVYTFNGTVAPDDQTSIMDFTPRYYGGFGNHFTFRGWDLDVLFQFVKQRGYNVLYNSSGFLTPGTMNNQPTASMNRWQQEGDVKPYQLYSTGANATYANANNYFWQSDGIAGDASFIRLKNVMLSYTFSNRVLSRIKLTDLKLFVQAQNLLTITHYLGYDPENTSSGMPPLRVMTGGVKFTF